MLFEKRGPLISMIILVAMLTLTFPVFAFTTDISLTSVSVNGNTYLVTGDNAVVNESFNAGDQPRFILNFSHNVSNTLDANLARLSMVKITSGVEQVIPTSTYGGLTGMGLVIRPVSGLENGNYKIIVAQGIQANAGTIEETYSIYFNVGGSPSGTGGGMISEDAHKIVFDIKGIAADTKYNATVKQDNQIFYPQSENTFFLEPGDYTYAVSASGYVAVTGELTVSKDETIPITMTDHVLITFSTTPADASVRVKVGQNEFIDPYQVNIFKLTPGIEYTYIVEAKGYITKAQRFTPMVNETKTVQLLVGGAAGSYCEQGNGGNTLTMLVPGSSRITVKEDNLDYSYNLISGSFDGSKEITFGFTMGAGVNNFGDGSGFKTNNMPKIAVYKSYKNGPQGNPVADYKSGNGTLKYIGFNAGAPEGKLITIGLTKGALKDGTYVLVFGKNLCGNNVNKTLGKDVVFEFAIGQSGSNTTVTEPSQPVTPVTEAVFSDVTENSWYKEAVNYVVKNGLFKGTSDSTFDPDLPMNRGMFVTVLGRLAKIDGNSVYTALGFTDVKADAYYAKYVAWAAEKGIVSGTGNGNFSPDRSITRQEAASIMFSFSKPMGYDLNIADNAAMNKFNDASRVAVWAADAVNWVLSKKVMGGSNDGSLNPGGTATRAQVAQIIMNFVNNAGK
ncbi:MAG: S-layer homology domain-containing protein [Syntrophomonas sp.]